VSNCLNNILYNLLILLYNSYFMFAGYIAGFKVFSRTAYQKDVQKTSRRYFWEISISSEYLLNICNMPAMWVLNDIAVIYLYDILQIYICITSNISTLSQKRTLVYFTNILEISKADFKYFNDILISRQDILLISYRVSFAVWDIEMIVDSFWKTIKLRPLK